MSNRVTLWVLILVLACMAIILSLNVSTFFTPPPLEKYLSYNGVRGMAIEHNKLLYTLNFDQQNRMIEYLNYSVQIVAGQEKKAPLDFSRLVIYRFNAP